MRQIVCVGMFDPETPGGGRQRERRRYNQAFFTWFLHGTNLGISCVSSTWTRERTPHPQRPPYAWQGMAADKIRYSSRGDCMTQIWDGGAEEETAQSAGNVMQITGGAEAAPQNVEDEGRRSGAVPAPPLRSRRPPTRPGGGGLGSARLPPAAHAPFGRRACSGANW